MHRFPSAGAEQIRKSYFVLFVLYASVMLWVWCGVFVDSGTMYLEYFALFIFSLIGTAALIVYLIPLFVGLRPSDFLSISQGGADRLAGVMIIIMAALVFGHFIILGELPVWQAFLASDNTAAALVRQRVNDNSMGLIAYIPTLFMYSLSNAVCIQLIRRRQLRLFWIILPVSVFYGTALLQKSFPLLVTVPVAIYCMLVRRYIYAAVILSLGVIGVLISFFATNPQLVHSAAIDSGGTYLVASSAGHFPENVSAPGAMELAAISAKALAERVVVHPGYVVSKWFESFPAPHPYAYGCGYRFLAPLLDCEFQNLPLQLHPDFYPRQASEGLQGSFNAAHFAEEYANFGPPGLVLAGALAASVLLVATLMTGHAGLPLLVAINIAQIAALSSAALHTTMLSFGWGLSMLLSVFLFPKQVDENHQDF